MLGTAVGPRRVADRQDGVERLRRAERGKEKARQEPGEGRTLERETRREVCNILSANGAMKQILSVHTRKSAIHEVVLTDLATLYYP